MKLDIDKILNELSHQLSDGTPNFNDPQHVLMLEQVLLAEGIPKEIVDIFIFELRFNNSADFAKYKSKLKGKMRDSTKVTISGKDTTAGEVEKSNDAKPDKPTKSKTTKKIQTKLIGDNNANLTDKQKAAITADSDETQSRLREIDTLMSNVPIETRNSANGIFTKGLLYEGRPNAGIGKNRLGYLDVKSMTDNADYLIKAYGDGSPKHIKKFVDASKPITVSDKFVNDSYKLLPEEFRNSLVGKGGTGDKGRGLHFLGYIREDGSITSNKNDKSIAKDENGKLSVKRGNPPSSDRGRFVWRSILEQGGKDPYTGLPLDLNNIDLEHVVAFDNTDNGTPSKSDYMDREHGDNIIICATNINQKKSNSNIVDFIKQHVEPRSGDSEDTYKTSDKAYEGVNVVATHTQQRASILIDGESLAAGTTPDILSEMFDLDDKAHTNARDTFKQSVDSKVDIKKIASLKSGLGKTILIGLGLGRGLLKRSGRGSNKLSSDNIYRGFLISMSTNPERREEYRTEWENARKVGNSDENRLAGNSQSSMLQYLLDKKLIVQSVLDDPKLGKVFANATK